MHYQLKADKYLVDIVVIRLLLIFLLVFYHSFAIYSNNWDYPYIYSPNIPLYYWLSVFSHGFQLEAMTFISGLIMGYIIKCHPDRLSFNGCILKKVKRILLPSLLFSIVYFLLFSEKDGPWDMAIYNIVIGCGHLWYLPMIFWCFVFIYIIEAKLKFSICFCLICVILLYFIPLQGYLPFRLGDVGNYLIYFYTGFLIMKYNMQSKVRIPVIYWLIAIAIYISGMILNNLILEIHVDNLLLKCLRVFFIKMLHLIDAVVIIIVIYSIANSSSVIRYINRHSRLIKLSTYCYGVYIYQQFILVFLYYHTSLPNIFGPVVLPWISCFLTICLCLFLCHYTLKTRVGRFLIG